VIKAKRSEHATWIGPQDTRASSSEARCGGYQRSSSSSCFDHVSSAFLVFWCVTGRGSLSRNARCVSTVHSRNTVCETNDTRPWQAGWFLFELPGCVHVRVRCYRSQSTVAERFSSGFVVSSNDHMMMHDARRRRRPLISTASCLA